MKDLPYILLVDDKVEDIIALEKILKDIDAVFIRAESGNEALEKILEYDFAIALIDVRLPDIEGFELMKLIREEETKKNLPIILLSAVYSEDVYKIKGIETGAIDFISKPIVPQLLLGRISIFLELYKQRKTLERKEERFRDFFEEAPIGFHIFGPDGIITDINQSELDMIGYTREEIIGKKRWRDLILPEEKDLFEQHWKLIRKTGLVKDLEYTLVHKKGHHIKVLLNASANLDPEGALVNTRGSVVDITKRKHVEEEINSLARYPEENPNPVLRINKEGKILYCNKEGQVLRDIWNYDPEEKLPSTVYGHIKESLITGKARELEVQSDEHIYLILFSPVPDSGYVNLYGTDITRLMQVEQELIAYKDQLENMVRTRTEDLVAANKKLTIEIQERIEAEVALEESEEKFRTITASAPDAIIMIDHEGNITFWNKTAEILLGYTQKEIIGKNVHTLLAPERYKDDIAEGFKLFMHSGKGPVIGSMRKMYALHKNGSEVPVELSVSALLSDEKWHAIGVLRDISEREKSEQEISRLATVIEQVDETVVITDPEGKIEYANPFFEKETGYTVSEALGKNPGILKSGLHGKEFYKELWSTIKSGNTWEGTFINRKKDGTLFHEEASIFPIKESSGNIINYAAVKRDITERKNAEQELVKLSRAVKQSLNIVMIVDRDNVVEYVNPKFSEITGFLPEDIIGKEASILGTHSFEEQQEFLNVLNAREEWQGELYNRKKNGEFYWEYASVAAVKNQEGVITHYVKDAVDITKRKSFERELREAKEKAEQASRAKGEFLANMSHEIRTPMNSILGFIEMLGRTGLSRTQAEYLNYVENSSKGLLQIINDILDFSKLESKKFSIDLYNFSPLKEFEMEVEIFQGLANEKGVELITYIDPSFPASVTGDALRIRQVINNLVSNAIKFTPEGGYVLIDIENIGISDEKCRIYFSISDTGKGITDIVQKDIFKAFRQEDASVTRRFGGTGLGLAISNDLVDLMGGKLELNSEFGLGSRFFFDIELSINEHAVQDNEDIKETFTGKNIVLYLPENRETYQEIIIARYLASISREFKLSSDIDDICVDDAIDVLFYVYSPSEGDEFVNFVKKNTSVPVILVATIKNWVKAQDMKQYITKFINQPVTFKKIVHALKEIYFEGKPGIIDDSKPPEEKITINARALVAEDNEINQRLVSLMLNEMGISVDIAGNGLEAIKKFKSGSYDIILMDINMPILDGIESTKNILLIEKEEKRNHIPIIALTAKAIKGDREMLLKEGLDDYISKPIDIAVMKNILFKYLGDSKTMSPIPAAKPSMEKSVSVYDLDSVAEVLGIPSGIVKGIIEKFIATAHKHIEEIEKGIYEKNFETISKAAHKFKGSAANLRFDSIAGLLQQIEISAKNSEQIDYLKVLDEVQKEIESIKV
ncbi:MAG: PAS domain S-box protein [bacterium]|nr:PAS domain S-box protein [bacterium]